MELDKSKVKRHSTFTTENRELECHCAQTLYLSFLNSTMSNPCLSKHTCCLSEGNQVCCSIPSSLQRKAWFPWTGSVPISRKWIIMGFKPVLPYLWSHICDHPKFRSVIQFCPIRHKGNSPGSFWEIFHASSHYLKICCVRTNAWSCLSFHHDLTSFEWKRQCTEDGRAEK